MRYDQINIDRLDIISATLQESHRRLKNQDALGIDGGKCCNHLRIKVGDSEREIGCLVGVLVGIGNFAEGSTDTASTISESLVSKAFSNATLSLGFVCPWSDLSQADKRAYRALLSSLQNLHDASQRFGFESVDFVLFVLTALIKRIQVIRQFVEQNSAESLEWTALTVEVGCNYESSQTIIERIERRVEEFAIKK